jgi:hypothetical protein
MIAGVNSTIIRTFVRTFINVITYPQYNSNKKQEKKKPSEKWK